MTGISLAEALTPLMCVEKCTAVITVAQRYSIIQIGICLFHKDPSSTTAHIARRLISSVSLLLQDGGNRVLFEPKKSDVVISSSAIAFLRRNKMDFQKWFYQGIPYCNDDREKSGQKQRINKLAIRWRKVLQPHLLSVAENGGSSKPAQLWRRLRPLGQSLKCLPITKSRAAREAAKSSLNNRSIPLW